LAENVNIAVNLAFAAHPVKSMVISTTVEPPGARPPRFNGNVLGGVITGVQAAPAVCVRLNEFICKEFAAAGPLLVIVSVQTLALAAPVLLMMLPLIVVGATGSVWAAAAKTTTRKLSNIARVAFTRPPPKGQLLPQAHPTAKRQLCNCVASLALQKTNRLIPPSHEIRGKSLQFLGRILLEEE
jgi:hypothetical protein